MSKKIIHQSKDIEHKKSKTPAAVTGGSICSAYKVGDWIFCEFKLQQVVELQDGHVSSVTDGWFEHGSLSLDDRIFPLEKRVKRISDNFENWSRKLHREGHRNLNFPDIHHWLVSKWCEVCESRNNDKAVERGIKELDEWGDNLMRRCQELKDETIGGIRLFRS